MSDRALALDDVALAALVVRELSHARRHTTARTVLVETVPVALWLASFAVLAPGQAILVGVLLVAPYAAAVGLVGHRAEFAADDAAAALLGTETVAAAIERAAGEDDAPVDGDPLFDLLAGRPAPRRRVERLRAGDGAGGLVGFDGDDGDGGDAPAAGEDDHDGGVVPDDVGPDDLGPDDVARDDADAGDRDANDLEADGATDDGTGESGSMPKTARPDGGRPVR